MRKFRISFLLIFLWFININKASSQPVIDTVYDNNIHTVQIYKEGWELSYPVINLNSDEKIKVSFDDFDKNAKNYLYTLVHCNSDWEPSDLLYSEFADGFEQNKIINYSLSTNTIVNYIHYAFDFPNETCNPKISGNYIVKVFEDFDENKIVFTSRFYVNEAATDINISIIRPELPKYMFKYQQFKITVKPNVNDYTDLKSEIKTVISQNNEPAMTKANLISRLSENNMLIYDDPDSNLFEGGNEFRNFDIKSIKYQSQRIKEIKYAGPYFNIELHPDDSRRKTPYFSDDDLNGSFYIQNSEGTDKTRDADYVMVHLVLNAKEPFIDGDLFVYGALTHWKCDKASQMKYNLENLTYELQLQLKQGYYNYEYVYKPHNGNDIDLSNIEGNHYETENDYLVYVYYKPFSNRYERLIGFRIANSIKQGK